jgi:putative YpdA family bacillithiol system oxidoreductase
MLQLTASYSHLLVAGLALTVVVLAVYLLRRWREDRRARKKLAEAIKLELNVPTSLHPVIDPDVCIGSGSCISACPEGKILGMIDGVATLLNASKCIGHGKCAAECPVDAIKLVFGSAERGVELPEVDAFFETSRTGVHIVGELAGMGLIKNALVQGLQVAARFRDTIDRRASEGAVDVVIVGAGPAGIATAVGCRAAGLSYALLEQDTVGGTVAHYPRQKLVMTETVDLPFYGKFGQTLIRKETLVSSFQEVIAKAGVKVHEKTKLTALGGEKDNFLVTTDKGVLTAKRVVLAIGRRGTPRKMGVPGEDLEKVAYRLIDARQYSGRRVLVVGGGDSALEAAIQLAEESDATVAISYRRPEFARCRPLNKQKIDGHIKSGRIKAMMSTEVVSIDPETVSLKNGTVERVSNDFVIACLGGELPNELLNSMGISIRRHHGDKAMANPALARKAASKRTARIATWAMFLVGALVVIGLTAVGIDYYLLPRGLRYKSPDHALLKPSGLWGHGVGILATIFMLLNFIYPLRKRLPMFKGKGTIAPWLRFHVFVGIMSPLVILFHTAFQWGNQLATSTYVSVVVVVATGLIGRYIYGWVRLDPADAAEAARLGKSLADTTAAVPAGWRQYAESRDPALHHLLGLAGGGAVGPRSLPALFFGMPREALLVRRGLRHARRLFLERAAHRQFARQVAELRVLRTKMQFHRHFKRLMSAWRSLHVVLAIVLLALIGTHVWVSLRVGFRWLWK